MSRGFAELERLAEAVRANVGTLPGTSGRGADGFEVQGDGQATRPRKKFAEDSREPSDVVREGDFEYHTGTKDETDIREVGAADDWFGQAADLLRGSGVADENVDLVLDFARTAGADRNQSPEDFVRQVFDVPAGTELPMREALRRMLERHGPEGFELQKMDLEEAGEGQGKSLRDVQKKMRDLRLKLAKDDELTHVQRMRRAVDRLSPEVQPKNEAGIPAGELKKASREEFGEHDFEDEWKAVATAADHLAHDPGYYQDE